MRYIRYALIFIALIILFCGGFAIWFYYQLNTPHAHEQAAQYIEIPRGSTPVQMFERIEAAGVIRRAWIPLLYLRLFHAEAKLKAGDYRFPSPVSLLGVIRKLEEGEARLSHFIVIEGWTRWDIANALARVPELKIDATQALELMNDTSPINDLDPQANNLEGYLFPDTYNFPPNATPRECLNTMVRRFRQVWKNDVTPQMQNANRSPREIVTVASLIETEAKLKEERPVVASVIYNRLKTGMPLGIDSSIIYASKLAGKWRADGHIYQSDLDRDSPYNTRKVKGLPPSPVASPGAHSLVAAVAPADTDYLYYVRNPDRDDGAHNFYTNESDFQRGVQALRAWEQTRNAQR